MKKFLFSSFLLISICTFFSCNYLNNYPEKVFNKVGLNANKIPRSFGRAFKEIQGQKAVDRLVVYLDGKSKKASVVEYVDYHYKSIFDDDIKDIEELKQDEETKPIIEAGLDMFRYADVIYKEDYPRIAQMIDEGYPDEEIQAAIAELDNSKGAELDEKYRKTMELLIPYADKHGVEYKTINMP